jgi:FkbM family methyltransferase
MSIGTKLAGLKAVLVFDNWPMLVLGRLFDRKAGFVIYRKKGLEILVDHRGGDQTGTRQCIASNMYTRYLPSFTLRGPLRVLDLGANGGGFPLMLKIQGYELGRVVCVEMNPLTYQRLLVNVSSNLGASTVAINAAVAGSGQTAEILLKPSRGGTSESMYANRADASAPHVAVRPVTLQALYDQYFKNELIDICKVDIEGAEYEALEASPDELLRKIRYLVIELHEPARTPALVERIGALGFRQIAGESDHRTGAVTEVRVFRGPAAESASAVGQSAA